MINKSYALRVWFKNKYEFANSKTYFIWIIYYTYNTSNMFYDLIKILFYLFSVHPISKIYSIK